MIEFAITAICDETGCEERAPGTAKQRGPLGDRYLSLPEGWIIRGESYWSKVICPVHAAPILEAEARERERMYPPRVNGHGGRCVLPVDGCDCQQCVSLRTGPVAALFRSFASPAQVARENYEDGWERVFGGRTRPDRK